MKRLFLAINISPKNKDLLVEKRKEIQSYFDFDPVKWTKKENLHITLIFLGPIAEDKITVLKKELKSINLKPFSVEFSSIKYIPNRREAKLIWLEGESNERILSLQKKIEDKILKLKKINYQKSNQKFIPHITLGRTKSFQFKKTPLEEIPLLEDEFLNLKVMVDSIDLMESQLKKGGAQYNIIEKFK